MKSNMENENVLKQIEDLYENKEYQKSDELCKSLLKDDDSNYVAWRFRALNTIGAVINDNFEEKKLFKVINYVNKSLQISEEEKEVLINDYIDNFKNIKDKLKSEITNLAKDKVTEEDYRRLCEKCIASITILNILFGLREDKSYLEEILEVTTVYKKMYKSDNKKIRFALKEDDFNKYKAIIEDTNEKIKSIDSGYKIKNPPKDYESYVKDVMGGCYIATAVYGDYDAREVLVLRKFRDQVLDKTVLGRSFIRIYYKCSPFFAKKLGKESITSRMIKRILNKFVSYLESKNKNGL